MGNRPLMRQLFVNLFSNAIDAMPDGGRITVKIDCIPSMVRILISDSGQGIPEAHQATIFDPFFTTKPLDQGTGLGLYVSARIAQEHGGNLELKETGKSGTTFQVTLPLNEIPASPNGRM